mmetsp:Transcript_2347/g.6498  ORF Transcript_2347/g.6498 Transcript_2347/m.6498 type:complete len:256 (+) Transcript_2347:168-935(+)
MSSLQYSCICCTPLLATSTFFSISAWLDKPLASRNSVLISSIMPALFLLGYTLPNLRSRRYSRKTSPRAAIPSPLFRFALLVAQPECGHLFLALSPIPFVFAQANLRGAARQKGVRIHSDQIKSNHAESAGTGQDEATPLPTTPHPPIQARVVMTTLPPTRSTSSSTPLALSLSRRHRAPLPWDSESSPRADSLALASRPLSSSKLPGSQASDDDDRRRRICFLPAKRRAEQEQKRERERERRGVLKSCRGTARP